MLIFNLEFCENVNDMNERLHLYEDPCKSCKLERFTCGKWKKHVDPDSFIPQFIIEDDCLQYSKYAEIKDLLEESNNLLPTY